MENKEATTELERKIKEFDELNRVVSNGINWIADLEVKVAYIQPINEFLGFLTGFKANIAQQRAAVAGLLPKKEEPKVELTEAK